jgi:hypothetical protein
MGTPKTSQIVCPVKDSILDLSLCDHLTRVVGNETREAGIRFKTKCASHQLMSGGVSSTGEIANG